MGREEAPRRGFKPRDVEEAIDWHLHRPLAGWLVKPLAATRVTPNQVTLASGAVSMVAGVAVYLAAWRDLRWAGAGAALLFVSVILDCADGQLARVKGIASPVGRALDGMVDAVAPLSVMPAMVFLTLARGHSPLASWGIGWAAGLSLLWHAQIYDLTKNLYLHASRPDFDLGGSTLFLPEEMERTRAQMQRDGQPLHALIMKVWIGWTRPQLARLRPWAGPERTPQTDGERALYDRLFARLMRATTWLGFGTHLAILYVTLAVAACWPHAVWIGWGIIAGPLNVLAVALALLRRSRERAFLAALAELRQ